MITGQMSIHPQNSGKWLDMMFEELRKMHPYGDEFEKALAFYMGWLMHYCGDMYGHQYVNIYAYGWFPSIGEMFEHTKALIISPAMKAIMDYLQRHLTEEELNAFYENPDVAALANLILDVRKLLNCEPLFHVKGLEKSLNEQWARLGTEGRNCFNLECPMMENSLQMGKLCLLGAWVLNRLFETHIGPGAPFHASDVRWSLSELVLEIVPLENQFRNHDFTIFHEVVAEDSDGQLYAAHKQAVWSGGKIKGPISAELRLAEPLEADKIAMCRV